MNKAIRVFALLVSGFLSSCTLSKAAYLGEDIYSRRTGPQSREASGTEDINGVFPEAVYIKTRTQTFNSYHYYIVKDGRIWYKSIDPAKEPKNWTLFQKTGLPHNSWKIGFNEPEKIAEISADADELVALSGGNGFYRFCFDKIIGRSNNVWFDRQGWPDKEQLYFDRRTVGNLSWALGKRNAHVLYYEDPFGNQHHNGTMEIATTYVLLEDGQEICYSDTGLPVDFSRNYIGPERGSFKAVALAASASTIFVINEAGEMYTRLADFDTVGCDPLWFKYTYVSYKSDVPGTNYFSNLNEWGLPAEDWRPQPPVPLAGNAAITRHITILQNGRGNGARELRVAGLNESGETGYWTKAIFDDTWNCKPVPLYFGEDAILETAGAGDRRAGRGQSLDKHYSGYYWNGSEKENEWEYAIPNFNILEGGCDLRITWRDETCTLQLYPVEMWTYLKRNYLPGRTGPPKMFLVTLEIPENAFDGLSAEFSEQLAQKYAKNDRKLFQYTVAASDRYIVMRETGRPKSWLFLTDGTLPGQEPEFQQIFFAGGFEEVQRYCSPELAMGRRAAITHEELVQKIEANKTFHDELKYQIRVLKWSRLTAFRFTAGYIPFHYLITPLRFVDMPKIRTVTSFGDRIILTNNSYVNMFFNIRIWVYEKIIELLELRLLRYDELAKEFSETSASDTAKVSVPPRHSENIADYWDIAGLPRVISGTFFGPTGQYTQRPAVLSFFRSGTELEFFGWCLAVGESVSAVMADDSFSIFIDPLKKPEAVYSLAAKDPEEKRVQLDGTLYINSGTNSPVVQEIIDRTLKPFIGGQNRGIKVRIIFDEDRFEIRQRPAQHDNSLIFTGKAVPGYDSNLSRAEHWNYSQGWR
ncbi:MAG: hypothetical protein LBP29_07090 [Treponema sp.]|jgi:hypothetical protein|nr:hypothetical protein [Treponema sp.]